MSARGIVGPSRLAEKGIYFSWIKGSNRGDDKNNNKPEEWGE